MNVHLSIWVTTIFFILIKQFIFLLNLEYLQASKITWDTTKYHRIMFMFILIVILRKKLSANCFVPTPKDRRWVKNRNISLFSIYTLISKLSRSVLCFLLYFLRYDISLRNFWLWRRVPKQ